MLFLLIWFALILSFSLPNNLAANCLTILCELTLTISKSIAFSFLCLERQFYFLVHKKALASTKQPISAEVDGSISCSSSTKQLNRPFFQTIFQTIFTPYSNTTLLVLNNIPVASGKTKEDITTTSECCQALFVACVKLYIIMYMMAKPGEIRGSLEE